MGYNWHWRVLFETEPGGTGSYLHYLIVGLGWTLATALAAWVLALAIGTISGTFLKISTYRLPRRTSQVTVSYTHLRAHET